MNGGRHLSVSLLDASGKLRTWREIKRDVMAAAVVAAGGKIEAAKALAISRETVRRAQARRRRAHRARQEDRREELRAALIRHGGRAFDACADIRMGLDTAYELFPKGVDFRTYMLPAKPLEESDKPAVSGGQSADQ